MVHTFNSFINQCQAIAWANFVVELGYSVIIYPPNSIELDNVMLTDHNSWIVKVK